MLRLWALPLVLGGTLALLFAARMDGVSKRNAILSISSIILGLAANDVKPRRRKRPAEPRGFGVILK